MAKEKINSLRSYYRRVRRRMREAERLGMEMNSEWVYFKHFKFLHGCKDPLEEQEGGWSYCDDSRMDKFEEASLQGDVDKMLEIASPEQSNTQAYYLPTNSPRVIHHESINNDEDESMKYRLNVADQQQFWIEFIKLYESKAVLWKYGSDGYKDRELKKLAYYDLVEKMREVEANADVDMVKRKINSLRSTYRRALNKTKRAIRLGQEPDNSWVYFDHFAFLHENKSASEDDEDNSYEDCRFTKIDNTCDDDTLSNDVEENITIQCLPWKDISKRPNQSPSSNYSPKRVCSGSLGIVHKKLQQQSDEADILGIGWAYQYRNLSESQKLFAKKAIDDILFEARLGTLHRQSVKINESTC